MKHLLLLTILLSSIGLQAQTAGAPASPFVSVSAELSKKIDTKNAHVGDAVEAKTTNAVTLSDGTQLPKGTKLVGKLTDVRAKSNTDKTSHVAFSLDRAILRDGHEVSIHATLASLSVPSAAVETAVNTAAADASMPAMRGTGGGQPTTTLSGGASRSIVSVPDATNKALGNAVTGTARQPESGVPMAGTTGAATASAAPTITGPHLDHIAVAHLPGVTFSSALTAADTGSLDASGQNISVESWAQMTLIVSAGKK